MIVDYTLLSLFATCPMKCKLRIVDNLVPIEKRAPLSYGGAWHKSMASWFEFFDVDKAVKAFTDNYKDIPEDDLRTTDRAIGLLKEYTKLHKEEPFTVTYNERSFVKQVGEIEYKRYTFIGGWFLEREPITYAGRFDKILKWGTRIYVMEHKTTSRMGATYPNQFRLNMQVDGYHMLCKELMGSCQGVLIDAVRIAKTKPKKPLTNFFRFTANRSKTQLAAGEANIVKIAKAVWYARKEPELFYQDKGSCGDYGGCDYVDLCDNNFDKRIIRMRYRRSKWNPLLGKEE